MTRIDDSTPLPQGQAVYRQLLELISTGRLLPGTRLRETELSESLGVSRTPIREAVRLLEADGLVDHLPRQGATVSSLSYAEIMELYEMRAVLESTAARFAARAASDIELDELTRLNEEFADAADDSHRAAELNRRFHLVLQDAAKNRFLLKSIVTLQKAMLILGPTTLMVGDRAVEAAVEHRRILDALRARDGARAEAEMRRHIEAAHRVRLVTLGDRQRPFEPGLRIANKGDTPATGE